MHKARLTLRRIEILKLIAEGYTNKEIPEIMGISYANFKLQKWKLYSCLNANNTKEAKIGRAHV